MKKAARETLYGKLAAKGWDKIVVKGLVESMTQVEIGENGGIVKYVQEDGQPMRKAEKNGDLRPYTDEDLIEHLTNHEIYGKLVPSNENSGSGGESNYNSNHNSGAKIVSRNDVSGNLEAIANGQARLAE